MSIDFTIKRGDTAPSLAATLKDGDGNAVSLTGASVKFQMALHRDHSQQRISKAATVTDAANGGVQYDWEAEDTDTAGFYDAEWEVTYSGGGIETFPSDKYTTILVKEDLDQ